MPAPPFTERALITGKYAPMRDEFVTAEAFLDVVPIQ